MNDKYLYRAKRTDNGEWVEGCLLIIDDSEYRIATSCLQGDVKELLNVCAYEVDQSTICQCTGLKDKNGKLIFENDIVKFDVYEYEKLVSSTVSEIKWCEELCSLSVVVNKQGIRGTLGHFLDLNKEVEVIGSAIDNPELLEK